MSMGKPSNRAKSEKLSSQLEKAKVGRDDETFSRSAYGNHYGKRAPAPLSPQAGRAGRFGG